MASIHGQYGGGGYRESAPQGHDPYAQFGEQMHAEMGGRPPAGPGQRIINIAGALSSVALVAGICVWGYKLAMRDIQGVPVVRAIEGPARISPEDPGGELARHVGLSVNSVAGTGLAAPGPDQVTLAPDPTELAGEDIPMGELTPLQAVARSETTAQPRASAPAPRSDADAMGEATGTAREAAPLEDELGSNQALVEEGAEEGVADGDEAALAASPDAIPASVPGVQRSPRPMGRPARDLVAEAAAEAVAASLGGGAAASASRVVELDPSELTEGTRLVQLGAFDSPEIARAEWDRVAARFESLMEGKQRVLQEATSGGRQFWRLRVAGFDDVDSSRRFCAALVAEGSNCIPARAR